MCFHIENRTGAANSKEENFDPHYEVYLALVSIISKVMEKTINIVLIGITLLSIRLLFERVHYMEPKLFFQRGKRPQKFCNLDSINKVEGS